ncbi:MAG: sigma-70 family RNA polymerase sigma factor [Nocardioidaceae bacterium]
MTSAGVDRVLPTQTITTELSALARAARAGGMFETETLLRRVRLVAHRYSVARLWPLPGGTHLAEDVAQETCLAVLAALPRYRDSGAPFEAFVRGIAAKKVADARRAMRRTPVSTEEVPDVVDSAPTPEERLVFASETEAVSNLLNRLPATLRDVMVLRVLIDLSTRETAATLGMSAGAVRVAQHRALCRLREYVTSNHCSSGTHPDS